MKRVERVYKYDRTSEATVLTSQYSHFNEPPSLVTATSDSSTNFPNSADTVGPEAEALFGWGPPVARSEFGSVVVPVSAVGTAKTKVPAALAPQSANHAAGNSTAPCLANSSVVKVDKGPLIDWNICKPDGKLRSLHAMLGVLSIPFRGQIAIGFSSGVCEFEWHDSRETGGKSDLPEFRAAMRSAVVEAKQASQSCLFATASGQSSLVLQQLRQFSDDAVLLAFSTTAARAAPTQQASPAIAGTVNEDDLHIGVVIAVHRAEQILAKEVYAELIAKTQTELQAWLRVWCRCRAGAVVGTWSKRFRFYRQRKWRVALAVAAALLACMAIPIPYWPRRSCVVEPRAKCFVASPIDGRIGAATVRPGDLVKQGQVLAQLDDEQLQWQLSTAKADYDAACKRRDTALATRAGGELRLAQLEQERFALQIEALEQQLERLELRSPADGVVVQGDWFQSDGAPVLRGDMLFEIAPMDTMRVEIHLSTEDLARIEVGNQATVRVDAAPGETWTAAIHRIDPRGKVIDSEVVFGANIDVENSTLKLRPGMKGSARISAGSQSIGWLLFHRPVTWAMKKLAW